MASKSSKGSWTLEEVTHAVFDYKDNTAHSHEPLTIQVETALVRALPFDLYPFALELVRTKDGFLSKNLALNFLGWIITNKAEWLADPDKILSLRRIRVDVLCNSIRARSKQLTMDIVDASVYAAALAQFKYFNMPKKDFSNATMMIAKNSGVGVLEVFRILVEIHSEGYDVAAALWSCAIWYKHMGNDKVKQPSLL